MKGSEIAKTVTPPPMPWSMQGRMYMLLRRIEGLDAPPLPSCLRLMWPGHRVFVLVRYLEGTLRYDELVIARLARHGLTMSMFVDHIWVDSEPSVSGGRRFWGLPKELARFEWDGDRVRVSDEEGEIAVVSVDQAPAKTPSVRLPVAGFGVDAAGRVLLVKSRLRVCARRPSMHVERLAPRFGRMLESTRMGFDAVPFDMLIGVPRVLES